ncbi:conserved hypothetical protein, partial [Trichinella spiralis]|uniref:hypothetical protein n=1 Tax=Trichinella spiralis TaxID=6334 RepID=UPI0001EFEAF0
QGKPIRQRHHCPIRWSGQRPIRKRVEKWDRIGPSLCGLVISMSCSLFCLLLNVLTV